MMDADKVAVKKKALYTHSHEWVVIEGNIGTVGISDYAQKELGEIVYVELPKLGLEVQQGEIACVLESTKAAVDIYSPVSGKIIAVNDSLRTTASLINQQAHEAGWLFQIQLANPSEYSSLLTASDYQEAVLKPAHDPRMGF